TIPAIDINNFVEPNADLLKTGKNIFVTMCASCHGEDGKGNGPGAVALNPLPRNFENEEGWKNGITLSGIYTTLQEGIPGTGMISYEILTPKDKFSLIHYIRSEFISNPTKVSPDELAALDQLYNLSAGTDIPAQIPVADAIQIVVQENQSQIEKVKTALTNIQNSSSEGAILFCKVTDDEFIALSGLVVDKDWNDENSFKKLITRNLNSNGFNGKIIRINDNEWSMLFSFLKNNI
ncbi:MAG: cytochrome c, partial [Ignavibacteriaceae bacterium]|nr:cytochrome c [Ignavibacteriaceae bacterium]